MWRAQVITPAKDRASLSQPSPWSSPTRVPCCSKRSALKVNYHKRAWPRGVKRENRHDFVTRALAQEPWSSLAELELYVSKRALLNRDDGCRFCATGKWEFPEPWFIVQRSSIILDRNCKNRVLAMALPSKIWMVVDMSFHFFESWSSQFRHGQKKIWNFKFETKLTPYLFNQILQVSWGCCSKIKWSPREDSSFYVTALLCPEYLFLSRSHFWGFALRFLLPYREDIGFPSFLCCQVISLTLGFKCPVVSGCDSSLIN